MSNERYPLIVNRYPWSECGLGCVNRRGARYARLRRDYFKVPCAT
jgi:hypothetical protein